MKKINSWSDINIEQYIQLYNIPKEENLESENIELLIKQLGIIYDLSESEVENISISEFNKIKDDLFFLKSEPEQTNVKYELEIDGEKYFLNKDFTTLTLGEWIDIESFSKDFINNIHRVLSVLYRKENNTVYNPAFSDKIAETFYKKMDIETGLSAFFFFFLFAMNYIPSDTTNYSMLDKMIEALKEQIIIDENHVKNVTLN